MEWPFKHIGPDGKTYLHIDNWQAFRDEIENRSDHTWRHRRLFLNLHTPKQKLRHLGVPNSRVGAVYDYFKVIYEPYPAWVRTEDDPDAMLPSWNLFIEDGHKNTPAEQITLFSTLYDFGSGIPTTVEGVLFAFFRNDYWIVDDVHDYGIGTFPPTKLDNKLRSGRTIFREIHEEFDPGW